MSRWPFILVFAVVWLVVTGVGAWITEALVFRWLGRRYRLKPKQIAQRSLVGIKGKPRLWPIYALRVTGIGVAMFVGVIVGILAMALAIEVFP
jgi:hypothetical protein